MSSESKTSSVISRNRQNDVDMLNVTYKSQTCRIECLDKTSDGEKSNAGDHIFKIDILYGPISVCGVIKHRSERIEHIKGRSNENVSYR